MTTSQNLNNQLTGLKMAFDEAISNGRSVTEAKKIYLQIKTVKKKIDTVQIGMMRSARVEK